MHEDDSTDGDDPFEELDDPEGDPFAELDASEVADEAFVEMSVEELDDDMDFDELVDEVDQTDTGVERNATVVPKRTYCEQCEHFTAPPEVGCTNPGTEIVELVDTEHFRVVDCPIVERRSEVEGLEVDVEGPESYPDH